MSQRTLALVGPGRAGTAIAVALVARGWRVVGVAGRDEDRARRLAARVDAPVRPIAEVARDAEVVVVATPDAVIEAATLALLPALDAGTLVVHLSGARGPEAFGTARGVAGGWHFGALHPLQTLSGDDGAARLAGAHAAVEGPPAVAELAREIGLVPFRVDPAHRAEYHAAAVVASNHLVALAGQVERLAAAAGVPFDAFGPLMRTTLDAVLVLGPAAALTGPVARGDVATVEAHLAALAPEERDAYLTLAREAHRLSGRDDPIIAEVLRG
ncbi:MAG: hypothetical protein RL531_381 [Actinomycetota bacterium]|jgi:predicted short-subunit dehydrogenase-like oxidoreductase (DUF2520 family)